MSEICHINESYVVASIAKTKVKHFNEDFVTRKELNYIVNFLQKKYNEKDIPVIISRTMDFFSFWIHVKDVIVVSGAISDIEAHYTAYLPLDVLTILWDENYILKQLIEFRQEELNKAKVKSQN